MLNVLEVATSVKGMTAIGVLGVAAIGVLGMAVLGNFVLLLYIAIHLDWINYY